jgi:Mg-chelatase subunit ChlD
MSHEADPSDPARHGPAGWRRTKQVPAVPSHSWQVELRGRRSPERRWHRYRLAGLLIVLVGLIATFLRVAVDAPRKTPVLIVTDFRPHSIPQSPWLAEEIERLKLLNQTTLTIKDCHPGASSESALTGLTQNLSELAATAKQTGSVIVYVRLPGLVDDAGRPCLLMPDASLLQSEDWLPVEQVLDQIAGEVLPLHVHRLVVFDRCQPARVWQAGSLVDTFPTQLAHLMKRKRDAGRWTSLAVLTDTSAGQTGWAARTTGGSVFGEAVWLALSGQADEIRHGGNGDQHVTQTELGAFVTARTSLWARTQRGQNQTPALLGSTRNNVHLCWAAPRETQRVWRDTAARMFEPTDVYASLQQLAEFWKQRVEIQTLQPWKADPVSWQQLHRDLVRYEQLIAGAAGAQQERSEVERSVRTLFDRLSESVRSRLPLKAGEARLHHRHLTQRFSPGAAAENDRVSQALNQLRTAPSRQLAVSLLQDLASHGIVPQDWDLVVIHHLAHDAPDASWSRTDLMSRVLRLLDSFGDFQAMPEVAASRILEPLSHTMEVDVRAILDRLFVGTPQDLDLAEQWLTTTEEELSQAKRSALDLAQAIECCDRATSELPRLAEWVCGPTDQSYLEGHRQHVNDWVAATTICQQLNQLLELCQEQGGTPEKIHRAAGLTVQLNRELERLWTRVAHTYDRLLTAPVDPTVVAEMEHLLSTSLLPRQPDSQSRHPVDQRLCLYEACQKAMVQLDLTRTNPAQRPQSADIDHHQDLAAVNASVVTEPALSTTVETSADRLHETMDQATPHPMLMMLDLSDPASNGGSAVRSFSHAESLSDVAVATVTDSSAAPASPPNFGPAQTPTAGVSMTTRRNVIASAAFEHAGLDRSDRQAAAIRQHVANVLQQLDRDHLASFDSTESRDRAWRAQARHVCQTAPWLPGRLPFNPCQRIELTAWGRHLRRQAAAFAEDFWLGPADRPIPFFVSAAGDLLDAAELCEAALGFSLTAAGREAESAVRQQLARYRSAEQPSLQVTAIALPQVLATDDLPTTVSVTRPADAVLPAGTAAVFLSHTNGDAEAMTDRAAAPLPAAMAGTQEPVRATILLSSTAVASSSAGHQARAIAYFRGHRFIDDFPLAPSRGLTVVSSPGANSPTSVTVRTHQRRPNAILLILDASASMTDSVAREGTRGSIRKLDAAVDALSSLLEDLSEQPEVQVGVVLYGHRVAAGETAASGVVRQPLYLQRFPFPANLQPFEDIETVLPMGRFGRIEQGMIDERLRWVKPWGETPLYLSIIEGLRQFETLSADVTKTMIVITDGLNYQFNPTPEKQTLLQDVLNAVVGQDVAIHLVGFGLADQHVAQARQEFSRISFATGGSADVTVRDAGRLRSHLRSLYQPARFSIEGQPGTRSLAEVGQPIMLPTPAAEGDRYELRFAAARSLLSVWGGEKLVFRPAEDGTLRVVADLPERAVSLQARDSGHASPCEIVASRPVWKGSQLVVRWSLRQRDGQFTPRPRFGYFHLTPLDSSGTDVDAAAVCMGPADVPGQPLPTWEFRIADWPRSAVTLRLEGWVCPESVAADSSESIATLLEMQSRSEAWQPLPDTSVSWQIRQDGSTVTLAERYQTAPAEPGLWSELPADLRSPHQLDLPEPQPLPALLQVERRLDDEHQLFVQTWTFERPLTPVELSQMSFQFTRLSRFRSQSWELASSLFLPVAADALVIQPVPTITR